MDVNLQPGLDGAHLARFGHRWGLWYRGRGRRRRLMRHDLRPAGSEDPLAVRMAKATLAAALV